LGFGLQSAVSLEDVFDGDIAGRFVLLGNHQQAERKL